MSPHNPRIIFRIDYAEGFCGPDFGVLELTPEFLAAVIKMEATVKNLVCLGITFEDSTPMLLESTNGADHNDEALSPELDDAIEALLDGEDWARVPDDFSLPSETNCRVSGTMIEAFFGTIAFSGYHGDTRYTSRELPIAQLLEVFGDTGNPKKDQEGG